MGDCRALCRAHAPRASCARSAGSIRDARELSLKIFASYSESAAVKRRGEQGKAQVDAGRSRMNQNTANSMANLQAAHEARQGSYAAMNRSWLQGQDSHRRARRPGGT